MQFYFLLQRQAPEQGCKYIKVLQFARITYVSHISECALNSHRDVRDYFEKRYKVRVQGANAV